MFLLSKFDSCYDSVAEIRGSVKDTHRQAHEFSPEKKPLHLVVSEFAHIVERGDHVVRVHRYCRYSQVWTRIVAIWQQSVSVLEKAHGPDIFSPGQDGVPLRRALGISRIDSNIAITIDFAGLNHR